MEVATPGFLMEYGVRPNHIFVEYLIYPKEVSNTLWLGHKAELLAGFVVGTLALVFGWRLAGKCVHDLRFPPWQMATRTGSTGVIGGSHAQGRVRHSGIGR